MFISFYKNLSRNLAQTHSRPAQQDTQEWPQFLLNEVVSTRSKVFVDFCFFFT